MDIFFQDPSEVPLPPEEVRIRSLRAEPWPDGQRVRVSFEVDPFQKRPNAEIRITDQQDRELASVSVIETMVRKMEFTMHLRGGSQKEGEYHLAATLYYAKPIEVENQENQEEPPAQEIEVVDRASTTFRIA
jgi:hypothetical protein